MEAKDNESVDSKEESWTEDIEKICYDLLHNVKQMQQTHKKRYILLRQSLMYFRLPIIVISSANSVFSVGLTLFLDQQTTSVVNCLLSLICGIVSAVELFLGIQKGMDLELLSFHTLKLLAVRIAHQLKLDRCNRDMTGIIFLNSVMAEYNQIIESSSVNAVEIDDKLFELRVVEVSSPLRARLTPRLNALAAEI